MSSLFLLGTQQQYTNFQCKDIRAAYLQASQQQTHGRYVTVRFSDIISWISCFPGILSSRRKTSDVSKTDEA
jgi:hypothetical protein